MWFRSVLSRQRYRSVAHEQDSKTELDDIDTTKEPRSSSIPLSLFTSRTTRQLADTNPVDEDLNLLADRASRGGTTGEDSIANKSPKRRWIDGVVFCAKASSIILCLHLIFVAVAAGLASRYPDQRGFVNGSVMYEGSCLLTQRWSIALHLIINILSTVILGASNYCMQTLVAPTREDIDKAHGQKKWLDIGSASLRNLLVIGRSRLSLWMILLITATPFHLLYNSMIFESIGTNEFGYIVAPSDINPDNVGNLTTPELDQCFVYPNYMIMGNMTWSDFATIIAGQQYNRISTEQCMSYFNATNQRGIKALVALTPDLSVGDGGNDAILSVQVLEGMPSSSSTGGNYAVNHFGTNGYAAQGHQIWATKYASDEIALSVDGGPLYYTYNISSVNDCVAEGGKRQACANAVEVMDWMNKGSAKPVGSVRDYVDTHGMAGVNVENRVTCGKSESWDKYAISECLAVPAEQHCRLMYSPPICIVVALTTLVKVVAMFLAGRLSQPRSPPLLTLGDAVESFVVNPDCNTAGMCWLSSSDVHRGGWKNIALPTGQAVGVQKDSLKDANITYKSIPPGKRWMHASSSKRGVITIILCLAFLAIGAYLLQRAITSDWLEYTSNSTLTVTLLQTWWSQINTDTYSFINSPGLNISVLTAIVIANIPQMLLTICYYCYNGVLTSMLAAAEYSSYGSSRQPLRVTWPAKGSKQRSTYWLSVPYQYSVPNLVIYMILHWLVSQSIFYVTLIPYRPDGQTDWGSDRLLDPTAEAFGWATEDPNLAYGGSGGQTVNSLAYSPLPLFVALLVGAVMVLLLIALSFRKLKSDIPLAGSCSAAISAACHPPRGEDTEKSVLGDVMWGETGTPDHGYGDDRGHCSFTSSQTQRPSGTKLYA